MKGEMGADRFLIYPYKGNEYKKNFFEVCQSLSKKFFFIF